MGTARHLNSLMTTEFAEGSIARRKLILRDSLAILSLLLVTAILFAVTLFLFRSFSSHRADLAQRWSGRGRADLQTGKPKEAIVDLRTALTYAPGTRDYELLLAQALGDAGRTEESYQYFMGLWETEPGNGEINLALARLAAQRKDPQSAIRFYRASIYGTWEGDGVARRARVRLELARYFVANNDLASARMEALIAAGNAPDDYNFDMALGDLLQQASDPTDAWTYYRKAVEDKPSEPAALEAAGRLAYQIGDFQNARRLLERAQAEHTAAHSTTPLHPDDLAIMNDAARILEIMPTPNMPARERVARLIKVRAIAKGRLAACSSHFAPDVELPMELQSLGARWDGPEGNASGATLLHDLTRQDAVLHLAYDTEIQAAKSCGPATGDDALLLKLATTPQPNSPTEARRDGLTNVPRD
jgi:tetratricopeptide (TPR) repeat protein